MGTANKILSLKERIGPLFGQLAAASRRAAGSVSTLARRATATAPAVGGGGAVPVIGGRRPSHLDIEDLLEAPQPFASRLMLYALLAMLVIAIGWAALSHVDRIVVAGGRLSMPQNQIVVQPFETSVVRTIDVMPGQTVTKGQVLATLDPTFTKADIEELKTTISSDNAKLARIQAELNGATALPAPTNTYEESEAIVFSQRRDEYRAASDALKQTVERYQAALAANQAQEPGLRAAIGIAQERFRIQETLMAKGYTTKLQYLDAKNELITKQNQLEALLGERAQLSHQYDEAQNHLAAYSGEWRSKLADEYVTTKRERDSASDRLQKAERRSSLVALKAPMNAVVLDVAQRAPGAVLKEAQPFITLVPLTGALQADVDIETRDVVYVHTDQPVQIKLEALPWQQHGRLKGTLTSVSRDTVRDTDSEAGVRDQQQRLVYRGHVKIDTDSLHDVPSGFQLIPGMRVTAEIKVGRRSVLSYLMDPITSTLHEGLREP